MGEPGKKIHTVTGKSYATSIQEFFVVPPEGVEKVWTWCNTAEGVLKLSNFFIELLQISITHLQS